MFRGLLADRSPYRKLLVLVGFALFFVVLFTLLGGLLSALLYGVNPLNDPATINNTDNQQVVNTLKLMQTFSALGLFVIPVFFAAFLFDIKPLAWLKLAKHPKPITVLLVFISIIISAPVINWMMGLNQHLSMPTVLKSFEEWMKSAENQAAELTKLFLETGTYTGLALNLFIIALLPAIGEELLFRGAVQRLLIELTRNKHAGIVLSAVAFSAMHMQFYGFLPRMMLGIYFGYLVLWSNSLWPAIIGHFINNATAVILVFLQNKNHLNFDPDTIGAKPGESVLLISAAILTIGCIWMVYRTEKIKTHVSSIPNQD